MNPLSLANAALTYGIFVQQQIALSEAELRKSAAWFVLWLFAVLNIAVITIIAVFYYGDITLLSGIDAGAKPPSRVIDSRVIMTLVAATTVQLGAFVLAIANYLFPKPERPSIRRRLFG